MESIRFRRWCSSAVSGIRHPPDRWKVYAELYGHMEDRWEALCEAGFSPEEAEERVLAAMGSAAEAANMLERIHRPYWAWALRAVRWLLLLALIPVLISLPRWVREQNFQQLPEVFAAMFTETERESNGVRSTRTFYAEPMSRASSDGYRFTLTRAAEWHVDGSVRDGTEPGEVFYLTVEVTNPRPWVQNNDLLLEFYAVDSLGSVYGAFNRSAHDGVTPLLVGTPYRTGLCTVTWLLFLRNYCSQGAEWLELRYDTDGRDVRLYVDLRGGGGE